MVDQIIAWTGIALMLVWVIAMFVTQIQYLIASFRSSVGLTLLSLIIPFLGLYVLIRFWDDLKRPFLNQLVVAVGGFVLFLGGGIALKSMGLLPATPGLPTMAMANDPGLPEAELPPEPPKIQPVRDLSAGPPAPGITPLPKQPSSAKPAPVQPAPVQPAPGPSWGTEIAVRESAVITIPNGWTEMPWALPNLAMATGGGERGEFVTVQLVRKEAHPSFEDFQQSVLQEVLQDVIEGKPPSQSRPLPVNGLDAVTYGMGGGSRLPGQAGYPVSARISCVDGRSHRYYIIQWRTTTWDDQSVQTFDRILHSFREKTP